MFYVYAHVDPITKEEFYIGMGHDTRAFENVGRNKEWQDRVKNLRANGLVHEVKILHTVSTPEQALRLERAEIAHRNQIGKLLVNVKHSKLKGDTRQPRNISLGAFVRETRKRAGLTQTELAKKAKTSQRFISELERGETNPLVESVNLVLSALGYRLAPVSC